jgi:hypothetical protein
VVAHPEQFSLAGVDRKLNDSFMEHLSFVFFSVLFSALSWSGLLERALPPNEHEMKTKAHEGAENLFEKKFVILSISSLSARRNSRAQQKRLRKSGGWPNHLGGRGLKNQEQS